MKKILTIFLVGFYLIFNAGLIVNLHFCSTAFSHLTVLTDPKNCCEGNCSCCDNAVYQLSIDDSYDNNVLSVIKIAAPSDIIQDGLGTDTLNSIHNSLRSSVNDKLEPDLSNIPAYLINRVFRI